MTKTHSKYNQTWDHKNIIYKKLFKTEATLSVLFGFSNVKNQVGMQKVGRGNRDVIASVPLSINNENLMSNLARGVISAVVKRMKTGFTKAQTMAGFLV